jgi:TRAP-type mannitol/chloroaromatic compound transport system substrate-binding protein
MGFPDFAKYMMVPGMHQPTGMLDFLINRQKWEALPDDLKDIVTMCCHEMVLYNLMEEHRDQAEFMRTFEEEYGVTLVESPDDIKEAFLRGWEKLVEEECAKTPYFAKVLESQEEYASKLVPYKRLMVPDYSFMADYYWPRK